jgi:hypothetical protein
MADKGQKKRLETLVGRGEIRGLTASMKFAALKKAKDYALETGQEFPKEAQDALRAAAKEWLRDALFYEGGHPSFSEAAPSGRPGRAVEFASAPRRKKAGAALRVSPGSGS